MSILELAKQSFGLLVPTVLHDIPPFNLLDLEDDALVRIQSVDEDGTINLEGAHWRCLCVTEEELKSLEEQLRPFWMKLTPTATNPVTEGVTYLNKEGSEALEKAINKATAANEALIELMKLR